jgi:ribokinase
MSAARDVCVLGSLNMDLVVRAPRLPQAGETLLGGPFGANPGGKGANQAVAAARMGASVAMIGCVGDDAHGVELARTLGVEGVDTAHVLRREHTASGVALITVSAVGENTIVVAAGANASLTPGDVERAADAIRTSRVLVMQLEIPLECVARAAHIARGAQVRVLLNAAPARELPRELLAAIDVLVVNEVEARTLLRADENANAEQLGRALVDLGVPTVVVTLGGRGANAFTSRKFVRQRAFEVAAVDTTAAGDAFVGALASSFVRGDELELALRTGCAAGALAATVHGAIASLPRRADVERTLAATAGS